MSVGGGKLEISNPYGQRVRQIEHNAHRLYHVTHEEEANAIKLLSVMELHRQMGHIAPSTACKLIDSGAVTGVKIDPESKESHCDACLYVRMTRKPIPSVRIRPPAENFSDEIHTDVWGPSRTATRRDATTSSPSPTTPPTTLCASCCAPKTGLLKSTGC